MTDLPALFSDKYQTLIALPYRVGLFISQSDRTGGNESDARELAALENTFTFYVEDTLKSEFAQEVMLATLQHKAYWKDWGANIDYVPDECTQIVELLKEHIDDRKLHSFKGNLIEIATSVALAYREISEPKGLWSRLKVLFGSGGNNVDTDNDPNLNISPAEKVAINKLAEAMGVDYRLQ